MFLLSIGLLLGCSTLIEPEPNNAANQIKLFLNKESNKILFEKQNLDIKDIESMGLLWGPDSFVSNHPSFLENVVSAPVTQAPVNEIRAPARYRLKQLLGSSVLSAREMQELQDYKFIDNEAKEPAPEFRLFHENEITEATIIDALASEIIHTRSFRRMDDEQLKNIDHNKSITEPEINLQYKVALAVNKLIKIPGVGGELIVWIGIENFSKSFPKDMIQDSTTIPGVGKTAKVEPFAPAFVIEPKETQCIKIDPSGSEVSFLLSPREKKAGLFKVNAYVKLFDNLDCSGPYIPKSSTYLEVSVEVDVIQDFIEMLKEKLIEFWKDLIGLTIAVIIFLIRKKLKRIIGYEN